MTSREVMENKPDIHSRSDPRRIWSQLSTCEHELQSYDIISMLFSLFVVVFCVFPNINHASWMDFFQGRNIWGNWRDELFQLDVDVKPDVTSTSDRHDASVEVGLSNWWSPYQWRHYWQNWWKDLERGHSEGLPLPEESKPTLLPNDEGPNVCKHRKPVGVFRKCRAIPGKRRLQCRTERHFMTEYKCCTGFIQQRGRPGCPKELYTSNKNIMEVAEDLGMSIFVRLANTSGLVSELTSDARYTVFVPSDQAFAALPPDVLQDLSKNKKQLRDVLLLHVVPGKLVTEAMKDNGMIKSLDELQKLRFNVADEGETIVVQGAEIVLQNQGASNGIIHVIDRVVEPAAGDINAYLRSDPSFSIFSQMLETSGMNFTNITLFAPTDQAFEVMDRERLENLLSNEQCVKKFVMYHMLRKPTYSAALNSGRFGTAEGHFIDIRVEKEGEVTVNDANVTDADISATNGIIHAIDKVLMPVSAMNLIEVAKVLNLTKLAQYLEVSGLSTALQSEQGPFTLFAPTDQAFEDLPESTQKSLRDEPAKTKEVLGYHVIPELKWTYEFGKDTLVNTIDEPNKLRLNSFRVGKVHAVNGACIIKANIEACNGVIHVIHKVLQPPKKTIYELLNTDPRFTTLMEAISVTGLVPLLQNRDASPTLFAPTNEAFTKLDQRSPGSVESLLTFPEELSAVIKQHLANGTLYTCGIQCKYSYWSLFSNHFSFFSLARGVLRIRNGVSGRVYINGARITELDITAINGVVHVVNDVLELYPQGYRRGRQPFRRLNKQGRHH